MKKNKFVNLMDDTQAQAEFASISPIEQEVLPKNLHTQEKNRRKQKNERLFLNKVEKIWDINIVGNTQNSLKSEFGPYAKINWIGQKGNTALLENFAMMPYEQKLAIPDTKEIVLTWGKEEAISEIPVVLNIKKEKEAKIILFTSKKGKTGYALAA